jgi:hypothetical protein
MTQRERVLHMLQTAGERGVTTADFLQAHIPRFSARIGELRKDGHVIETKRLREGSFLFKLDGQPSSSSVGAGSRGGSGVDFFENAGAASISTEDKGEGAVPAVPVSDSGAAQLFEMEVPTGHHEVGAA